MSQNVFMTNLFQSRKRDGMGVTKASGARRGQIEIMANILKYTRNPSRKTHIMYKCFLSFKQLDRYLRFLRRKALIRKTDKAGATTYQTTEIGREFLTKYRDMTILLRSINQEHA